MCQLHDGHAVMDCTHTWLAGLRGRSMVCKFTPYQYSLCDQPAAIRAACAML